MGKGSITVFLSFMLSLSIALVCTQLTSVKLAASRTQITGALDIGLYSLFAQYDRGLLEDFELFYLDGSFGSGELDLGKAYDVLRQYTEPVLGQNFTELTLEKGGWSGYCLATDDGGNSFYRQAVQAAFGLSGSQGIHSLLSKLDDQVRITQRQEEFQKDHNKDEILEQYDRELAEAPFQEPNYGENGFQVERVPTGFQVPEENPIEVIQRIRKMGILELVLAQPQKVSARRADLSDFVSTRSLNQGMGFVHRQSLKKPGDDLLFQEYLLRKCGNFLTPGKGKLSYQTEYILFGQNSDLENLKKAANRLLLLREGTNLLYLFSDGEKVAQASALAATISAALLLPMAEPLIRLSLLSCWAFGESILDVRQLFSGGKIPLVKSRETWQLSLEHLSKFLDYLDGDQISSENGLTYQDYLRILLSMQKKEKKVVRGMDMVECAVRAREGRGNFRLDCCISSMEAMVDVKAGNLKKFTAVRSYTYEES